MAIARLGHETPNPAGEGRVGIKPLVPPTSTLDITILPPPEDPKCRIPHPLS